MKQFIVFSASLLLGVFIYNLIAGPEDGSINEVLKSVWIRDMDVRTYAP